VVDATDVDVDVDDVDVDVDVGFVEPLHAAMRVTPTINAEPGLRPRILPELDTSTPAKLTPPVLRWR
jgi:hypothetical protein